MNVRKLARNYLKRIILDNNIFQWCAIPQWICTPSEELYCDREVVEVVFVETLGGIKGKYLLKVALLSKIAPGGSKVRGISD